MNIYQLDPAVDNPLFEGLYFCDQRSELETWPKDWQKNYTSWQPKRLSTSWKPPKAEGNLRKFNDYPGVNLSFPAFSQRAVDLLKDLLEPNGELLPLDHKIGRYYFYNCTHMTNCVDLTKSSVIKLKDGLVTDTKNLVFFDHMLNDLTIFKIRTQLLEIFCSQVFVDRVHEAGLQGFVFIPIWPLPEGVTFYQEMYRVSKLADKWRPKEMADVDIKGNSVLIRLYCERKKANKSELDAAEKVMAYLEDSLYNPDQIDSDSYYGNVEGHEVIDHEIRISLSAPDCDRLVTYLMPKLSSLPWPGKYHVVKRRAETFDLGAAEEYVLLKP